MRDVATDPCQVIIRRLLMDDSTETADSRVRLPAAGVGLCLCLCLCRPQLVSAGR